MKILYFNYVWRPENSSNAAAIQVHEIARALQKLGHNVVIYFQNKKRFNPSLRKNESSIGCKSLVKKQLAKYLYEPREIILNFKYLYTENRLIERGSPDLIITRFNYCNFSSFLLARVKKIPIISFADGLETYEMKLFRDYFHIPFIPEFIEREIMKSSNAIITVSRESKRYFVDAVRIPSEKIFVIPNGVDIKKFVATEKGETNKTKLSKLNDVVLGFVGNFFPWHDIRTLKMLITNFLKKRKDTSFLLVGDGELKEDLQNFVKENGFSNGVVFTGKVDHDDVPIYISMMDILLAPYNIKGDFYYWSPMKILEGMACSKAVLATSFGQVNQIIQDGYNGYLYRYDNDLEILEKTQRLIEDKNLRISIGKRARKTVVEKYSWDRCGKKISEICQAVLDKHINNRHI